MSNGSFWIFLPFAPHRIFSIPLLYTACDWVSLFSLHMKILKYQNSEVLKLVPVRPKQLANRLIEVAVGVEIYGHHLQYKLTVIRPSRPKRLLI